MTDQPASALAEPGVAQFYLNAAGRMGRAGFAAGVGSLVVTLLLYQMLATGLPRRLTAGPLYFALFCMGGVLLSKRLHDRGRSGWWAAPILFSFIAVWPYPAGWSGLFTLVLAAAVADLAILPGERRLNRFGPEPRRN